MLAGSLVYSKRSISRTASIFPSRTFAVNLGTLCSLTVQLPRWADWLSRSNNNTRRDLWLLADCIVDADKLFIFPRSLTLALGFGPSVRGSAGAVDRYLFSFRTYRSRHH